MLLIYFINIAINTYKTNKIIFDEFYADSIMINISTVNFN